MTRYIVAALLAATTVLGSVLVAAAGDDFSHYDTYAQQMAAEARSAARVAVRAARAAARDARWAAREAGRGLRRQLRDRVVGDRGLTRDARDRDREARAFRQVGLGDDPCAENRGDRDRGRACEVRDTHLPAPVSPLTVDAQPNGGIRVEGWDQSDVLVRAVVQTYGDTDTDAVALLPQVRVTAAGARVAAEGPVRSDSEHRAGWSVSFRIWAPQATALALSAHNGGITVREMHGESRFATENGGVTLDDVGGRVSGTTRNGGVNVRLSGASWTGAGLDVATTNGGVTLAVPANYSAALEVDTVNGGIRTDMPLAMQDRRGRELRTTLGSGGPLLKLRTVNGGVRINTR